MKHTRRKRLISFLLCMALLLTCSAWDSITAGAETEENITAVYAADGHTVTFEITSRWEGGCNAQVTITNTGEEKTENWKMNMVLAPGTEITGIWNAVKKEKTTETGSVAYQVSNAGWNRDIAPGESVSFGFQASCGTPEPPRECYLAGQAETAGESAYQILYRTTDNWQEGCIVEAAIRNLTDTDMEDWKLSFTWEGVAITRAWNAVMLPGEDGRYTVDNDGYNSVIPAGKSVTFSMMAETGTGEMAFPENAVLVYYGNGDGTGTLPEESKEPETTEEPQESPAATATPGEAEVTEEMRRWNRTMMHMDTETVQEAVENVREPIKVAILDTGVDELPGLALAGRKNLVPGGEEMTGMYEDSTGHGTALAALMVFDREEEEDGDACREYVREYFADILTESPDAENGAGFPSSENGEGEDTGADMEEDGEDGDYDEDGDGEGEKEEEDGTTGLGEFVENNQADFAGINPNMELYSVKVLDEAGEAPISRIIEGIEWAVENDIKILNISSGTEKDSEKLHKAVREAYEGGMLVIAAAGNNGKTQYPAAYDEVISAGSVDYTGKVDAACAGDTSMELAAPGEGVLSAGAFGVETEVSGTSMAAGEISAAASILWQQDATAENGFIRGLLLAGANRNGGTPEGCGIVDCEYSLEIYDEFKEAYGERVSMESGSAFTKDPGEKNPGAAKDEKAENKTAGSTGADMDVPEILELMEEAGIKENTEEPDTVEDAVPGDGAISDEGTLSANWNGKGHLGLLKYENGEKLEECLKALRTGIRLQDGEISTLKGKKEYAAWHGYYEGNYVAGYLYLSKLAENVFNKNPYKVQDEKLKQVFKDTGMPGIIQEDGIHTTGGENEDVSWDTIFRCKLGDENERADNTDLLDRDKEEEKNKILEDNPDNRALIVYGMAMHTMSDTFAHSCWGCKEEKSRCVWGPLKWSDSRKTGGDGKEESKYNDRKKVRPQRYEAARQAVYNALDHIRLASDGTGIDQINRGKVKDFCSRSFVAGEGNTECGDIINVNDYLSGKKDILEYLREGFGIKNIYGYAKACGAGKETLKYLKRVDLEKIKEKTKKLRIFIFVPLTEEEAQAMGLKVPAVTDVAVSSVSYNVESPVAHAEVRKGEEIGFILPNTFKGSQFYRIRCQHPDITKVFAIDGNTACKSPDLEEDEETMIEEWELQAESGITVRGRIMEAKDDGDCGSTLADARVSLRYLAGSDTAVTVRTDEDGNYRFNECLPGMYELRVEKDGYRTARQKLFLSGRQELYNNLIIRLIPDNISGKGSAEGCIRDSITREGAGGLTLKVRKGINEQQGDIMQTVTTDEEGNYSVSGLPTGHYCVEVVDERYITTRFNIIILGNRTTAGQNAVVAEKMEDGQMQIVLSWGDKISDLDASFGFVNNLGSVSGHKSGNQIISDGRAVAELNGNDTSAGGMGIETVKIYDLTGMYFEYDVRNISNGAENRALPAAAPEVRVYYNGMLWEEFYAPGQNGYIWFVFWYDAEANRIITRHFIH